MALGKLEKKIEALFRRAEGVLLPAAIREREGKRLDPDGARLALRAALDDVALVGMRTRLERLLAEDATYVSDYGVCGVHRVPHGGATRIYSLGGKSFAVIADDARVVLGPANELGIAILRDVYGEDVATLTRYVA